VKTCEWCGIEFEPSHEEQAYCKPTHAKKANRQRHKEREQLEAAGKCPTPYKRVWIDHPDAVNWDLPETQYLYHCRCGAIHAATMKRKRTLKAAA